VTIILRIVYPIAEFTVKRGCFNTNKKGCPQYSGDWLTFYSDGPITNRKENS